jgi:hypothetical protein
MVFAPAARIQPGFNPGLNPAVPSGQKTVPNSPYLSAVHCSLASPILSAEIENGSETGIK